MKKRLALIGTIVIVAALTALPLSAGPGGHGFRGHGSPGGHGMGDGLGILGHLKQLKEELALTDQQIGQIAGIFAEVHAQNEEYREQRHDGLHGAMEALLANPSDVAGAQALLDQKAAADRVMKANLLNATSKALGVLTAEQRAELRTIVAERHERRRGR
jgi:Spy/CpxP family protein refolding chaperone